MSSFSTESVFFAFDLLYFDGHNLTGTELSVRRHLLEDFLDGSSGAPSTCPRKCSGMAPHFSRKLATWASKGSSPSIGISPIALDVPATG